MAPPLTTANCGFAIRQAASPANTGSLEKIHTCRERVRLCLAQQPMPAWAAATRHCVAPLPPRATFAQQALHHVGWLRLSGDVLVAGLTVRTATVMQLYICEPEAE